MMKIPSLDTGSFAEELDLETSRKKAGGKERYE